MILPKPIRIAMAGLAHPHGLGFLQNALRVDGVSVAGFFDADEPARAAQAADTFGAACYPDFDALLDAGADVLLTAAVNNAKAPYIARALSAGIGVVADKPMATSLADLDAIFAAASSGAPLFLMLTERYDPAIFTAQQCIARGEIGDVVQQFLARPHRLRPEGRPAWMFDRAQYGGILNDLAVHDIDLARYFSGHEIRCTLAAHVSNARFPQFRDFCDNGAALFELDNGGSASIHVSWLTPDAYPAHGDVRFLITGTKGFLEVSTVAQTVRVCTDAKAEHWLTPAAPVRTCEEDALAKMADWTYPSLVDTADGLTATRFALLAQAAAEQTANG